MYYLKYKISYYTLLLLRFRNNAERNEFTFRKYFFFKFIVLLCDIK